MSRRAGILLSVLLFGFARPASAQWYLAAYFGASTTKAADIRIDRGPNTSLVFHDVESEARSFAAPPYYGYRFGRLFGAERRFGVELELIHLKVISLTGLAYQVTGRANNIPIDTVVTMSTLVERYSMTHGLNFILANVVSRTPIGDGRTTLILRGGAGPTRPHAETTIGGVVQEQYEWAGIGAHGAAGLDVRLGKRFSIVGEYKLTFAKPEIAVAGGTGRMPTLSHHVAAGLAFGFSR